MFQRLFSTLKQYKWTMGILSFIGLMLILLPIGIQLGIQKALQHQGADQISIEDVDFNLFTGRLTIKDLQIVDQQHIVLSADRLSLQMQLRALWQKHFLLKHMQLQHSFIQITQADPQSIQVAG